MFDYSNLHKKMASRRCPFISSAHPYETLQGVRPMREQIRSFRAGGLKSGSRELKDSSYDEDDSTVVDPTSEFGLDRFEKLDAITDQISDRMAAAHRDKLEHAEV